MTIGLFGRKTKQETGLPETPEWWPGSKPEYLVYWALLRLGMKDRFTYQSPALGGRMTKGGAIIDFLIDDLNLAINVTSRYWHYQTTPKRMSDELQRAALEGRGITVIYIDEADALRNPVYYVREALAGKDHSIFGRV